MLKTSKQKIKDGLLLLLTGLGINAAFVLLLHFFGSLVSYIPDIILSFAVFDLSSQNRKLKKALAAQLNHEDKNKKT